MARNLSFEPYLEQARRLQEAGDHQGAERLCRQVLAEDPKHAGALHLLGSMALQRGQWDQARGIYAKLAGREPDRAATHHGHGMALMGLGRFAEACRPLRRTLSLDPGSLDARLHLGTALAKSGQLEESVVVFRELLAIGPGFKQGYQNLSSALQRLGRLDEALEVLNAGLRAIAPFPEAEFEAGMLYCDMHRYDESIAAYRRALSLRPDFVEAYNNLALVLAQRGEFDEALACYDRAIRLVPDVAALHSNRSKLLMDLGRMPEAVGALRVALALDGKLPVAWSNLLLALHYLPEQSAQEVFAAHQDWNRSQAAGVVKLPRQAAKSRDSEKRLRVGYVSADLREHSVARMIAPVFENHSPDQIEIFAYSLGGRADEWTERLRRCTAAWCDAGPLSDQKLAERIRKDGIDILVDLGGHTAHNRLLVFARCPAPVQVSFLGYPDTTGLDAIDYRLTDSHADPAGVADALASETLVRLDPCAWCYPRLPELEIGPRAAGSITFGCFNTMAKINPALLRLWARILSEVPDSRLLLKAPGWATEAARAAALVAFREAGIAAERIEMLGRTPDYHEHLGLHRRVDIALDTYPYHGTNMTCEALWMGVPVVTMAGDRHVARVGVSLLTNVGHPEWIASNADDYVRVAVELAGDPDRLARLRAGLRGEMLASPLMDGPGYARRIEAAYREMWRAWCAGRARHA